MIVSDHLKTIRITIPKHNYWQPSLTQNHYHNPTHITACQFVLHKHTAKYISCVLYDQAFKVLVIIAKHWT